MRHLFASFTGKLVLALTALVAALGVFYLVLALMTAKSYLETVDQSLNLDVAARILERHLRSAIFDPQVNLGGDVFAALMEVNPNAEIYLLDAGGAIVAHAAAKGKVRVAKVDIEPIVAFVKKRRPLPIHGDDPRNPGERRVFSAAEIMRADRMTGYVYVVLGGEAYATAASMFRESHILRLSSGLIAGSVIIAMALGALSFYRLTRPLRLLTRAVAAFDPNNPAAANMNTPRALTSEDETGQLARGFEDMKRRITDQLRMLKEADDLRRQFMVYISHDLKTPIATIQGYLETLLMKAEEMRPEQRNTYLSSALRANERIFKMVEGIFELSKLEQPEAPLRFETFSATELVQDICQKLQFEANKSGVAISVDRQDTNVYVTGDIGLIERALVNIIENAVKFSDQGGAVGVKVEDIDGKAVISVANRGRRIERDELQKIFMPFYRGKHAGRDIKGNGLGLTIARRVVELHGGRIDAVSDEDRGTRFTITLNG
jgi:signal transduction histidine kinase